MDSVSIRDPLDPAATIGEWQKRPAAVTSSARSAITVDVEDWFQVEAFFGVIDRVSWPGRECRIERNVERILAMFEAAGVSGTFFTLAWVAERYPSLIRRIVEAGHELASHGSEHQRADAQTRPEFAADVRYSKAVLEDIGGTQVKGYRAPSFSVMAGNLWALDVLAEAGYRYSSSINPIAHDIYGMPEAPRFAFHPFAASAFLEIPVSSLHWAGRNWPCGGGGYFRLLPFYLSKAALQNVTRKDGQPLVFYFHPWEIDPGQPYMAAAPIKSRLRHYTNLSRMEAKIARLLRTFSWARMDEIFLPEGRA